MTSKHLVLCNSCKHYAGDGTCVAFPSGIPDQILLLGGDHRSHVKGDDGVVFSPLGSDKAQQNLRDWLSANQVQ